MMQDTKLQIIHINWGGPEVEFEYKGRKWLFEEGHWGPWPLRKSDGEPFKRVPMVFWEAYQHYIEQERRKRQSEAAALPSERGGHDDVATNERG